MTIGYASVSDVGRVRGDNQDAIYADGTLFIVADGMGGAAGGDVASRVAVDALVDAYSQGRTLREAVEEANSAVIARALAETQLEGMGTTMVALTIDAKGRGTLINVGDSRAYLYSQGRLSQLTSDHTFAQELVEAGSLTREQAQTHRARHVLTRVLGAHEPVEPDTFDVALADGDQMLLCSDGLVNEVSDRRIEEVLGSDLDLEEMVSQLIDEANENGGKDNTSVVVVAFSESGSRRKDVTAAPVPPASRPAAQFDRIPRPISRRSIDRGTWMRTAARFTTFVAVVLIFVALMVFAVDEYATHSYYVGFNEGRVAIFQGRPGGILWFQPHVIQLTSLKVSALSPALFQELKGNVLESNLSAAKRFVSNVAVQNRRESHSTLASDLTYVVGARA